MRTRNKLFEYLFSPPALFLFPLTAQGDKNMGFLVSLSLLKSFFSSLRERSQSLLLCHGVFPMGDISL